jgi:ankyrin repeat protein
MTALAYAVALTDSATCVAALVAAGADPRLRPATGSPLLVVAAEHRHSEVLRQLLRHGVDVNERAPRDTTALMAASRAGDANAVALLLAAGADVHARNSIGETALMAAAQAEPGAADVAELLLAAGADVDAAMMRDMTPLAWASMNYTNFRLVALLLAHGADPHWSRGGEDAKTARACTSGCDGHPFSVAMDAALVNGSDRIALLLAAHGAVVPWRQMRKPGSPYEKRFFLGLLAATTWSKRRALVALRHALIDTL